MTELLQPLLMLIILFGSFSIALFLRRRLVQDTPLGILVLSITALAAASLIINGKGYNDIADILAISATVAGLFFAEVPSVFGRLTLRARILGHVEASRRFAIVYWCLRPGAKAWLMWRNATLLTQLKRGDLSPQEALDAFPRYPRMDITMALITREFRPRIHAIKDDWDGLARLHSPDLIPIYTNPPSGAGELMIRALCEASQSTPFDPQNHDPLPALDQAAEIIDAMEVQALSGKITPPESDAFHNRARLTFLAFAGRSHALKTLLDAPSTLRSLLLKEELTKLLQTAQACQGERLSDKTAASVERVERALEVESRLTHTLSHLSMPAPMVALLIAICAICYLLSTAFGDTLDPEVLLRLGGCFRPLVLEGQWWRIFSSMWLHAMSLHFLFNAIFLLIFGNITSRLIGPRRFLAVYLFSGIAGALTHLTFGTSVVMVGASGAIFGIFGAALMAVIIKRHELPRRWVKRKLFGFIVLLVVNAYLSVAVEFVSLSAHAGGFAAGMISTFLLLRLAPDNPSRQRLNAGSAVLACFYLALTLYAINGIAGSLKAPLQNLIPTETTTFTIKDRLTRFDVRLSYPLTWQVRVRQNEDDALGPRIIGPEAQYISTSAICTPHLTPALQETSPEDKGALAFALNQLYDDDMFEVSEGQTVARQDRPRGEILSFARKGEHGVILTRFFVAAGSEGGLDQVRQFASQAELIRCRLSPQPH